jgi:hypothetical protein
VSYPFNLFFKTFYFYFFINWINKDWISTVIC